MSNFNEKQKDAYARAAALCSRAEKSPGAITEKLRQWELEEEEMAIVMQRLLAEKYLDEERFARSYVRDKFRFNQWGRVKIAFQLKAEKISPQTIHAALDELDDDSYRECLFKLLSEKDRKTKAANDYDRKAKLFRFAQGRGFEADLIWQLIGELLQKQVRG